jgi:hypothetical protein
MKNPPAIAEGLVPHIGELSNQYKEELQLLYKLKGLIYNQKS